MAYPIATKSAPLLLTNSFHDDVGFLLCVPLQLMSCETETGKVCKAHLIPTKFGSLLLIISVDNNVGLLLCVLLQLMCYETETEKECKAHLIPTKFAESVASWTKLAQASGAVQCRL
jgi:hypothetical protein